MLSKDRGEIWLRGYLLNYLTQANWLRGDKRRAKILGCEAATIKHAIDDRFGLTIALETLAWMAAELGSTTGRLTSWASPSVPARKAPRPWWTCTARNMSSRCPPYVTGWASPRTRQPSSVAGQ